MAEVPKGISNKDDLFQFLSEQLAKETTGAMYHLLATKAELVLESIG